MKRLVILVFIIMLATINKSNIFANTYSSQSYIQKKAMSCISKKSFLREYLNLRTKNSYTPTAIQIWNTTWGGNIDDYGVGVFVYGDYIYVVGYTESFGAGSSDVCLLKYDLNGNKIWNITWGGDKDDYGVSVFVYGDYIYVVGYTESFGAGSSDVCLLKYDLNGNKIWNITWGGSNYEEGDDVFVYGDYIYITGHTYSFGVGACDVCLLKYDLDGNLIWSKTWGGSDYDWGSGIFVYGDYIYAIGHTNSLVGHNICLLKYDIDGNFIWNVTWKGSQYNYGRDVFVYSDYIYVVGYTYSFGAEWSDICLLKYDLNGNLVWNVTWGGSDDDWGWGVSVYGDYIYVAGHTYSFGAGGYDVCLLKYDLNGNKIWNITWGESYNDISMNVFVYGAYIYAVGCTNSSGAGGYDICLLKFDSDDDGDGLGNHEEEQIGSDPTDPDTDGDGMPDGWEVQYGLDPLFDDSSGDSDGDGLSNLGEYQYSTDPTDNDTDDDGMADGWEVVYYFNPNDSSDADGDADGDGLSNLEEFQLGTNPRNGDSDGDGWSDGDEVQAGTDPLDLSSHPLTSSTTETGSIATTGGVSTVLGGRFIVVLIIFVAIIVTMVIVLAKSRARRGERVKLLKDLSRRPYRV